MDAGPIPDQPALSPQPAAWPPAPNVGVEAAGAATWFWFTEEYRKVRGHLSDFRAGALAIGTPGIYIEGKTVPRGEIRVPILVVFILLAWPLAVIASVVMEYACRRPAALELAWIHVRSIVIALKKRRICLVYDAPNYRGKLMTFSLAFRLDGPAFAGFVDLARTYAPDRVVEGRIPGATSPVVWILLIVLIAVITVGLIFAAISSGPR